MIFFRYCEFLSREMLLIFCIGTVLIILASFGKIVADEPTWQLFHYMVAQVFCTVTIRSLLHFKQRLIILCYQHLVLLFFARRFIFKMKVSLVPLMVLILRHLALMINWSDMHAIVSRGTLWTASAHLIFFIHPLVLHLPVLVLILKVFVWCIGTILFVFFLTNMLGHLLFRGQQLFLIIFNEIICIA